MLRIHMTGNEDKPAASALASPSRPGTDTLLIRLAGSWRMGEPLPTAQDVLARAGELSGIRRAVFDASEIVSWDSSLAAFLASFSRECECRSIQTDPQGLPPGVQRLLRLAAAFGGKMAAQRPEPDETLLALAGERSIDFSRSFLDLLEFIGGAALSLTRLVRGKARFRLSELMHVLQQSGPNALPIIFLISALVGVILAFVGTVQLKMFEAQVYIANVVGIAMAREMGPMMTAIIMMGRTGAAFAAHLGTMETNEEIDAFRTWGIDPMEFLVLPRMVALVVMMPLLTIYADLIGILGGAFIGVGMFDLSLHQYLEQTRTALSLTQFGIGLSKSIVFGMIIAISGCFYGMRCGRRASAVGDATTRSVVSGIVFIVVADGIFAVITNALWI
ncbi:MAG: ABC transporter permease [Desulfomonilia bacterium]|nr:ABC transporter permease [Desulfomonilia bacterium]HPW68620.1 ABC transporter permease [Deltaproteobacteria bacterium]